MFYKNDDRYDGYIIKKKKKKLIKKKKFMDG